MPKPKREIPVSAAKRGVRLRIKEIKKHVVERDYEAAHAREDDLRRAVLAVIAEESVPYVEMVELAKLALLTEKLKFPRDCA